MMEIRKHTGFVADKTIRFKNIGHICCPFCDNLQQVSKETIRKTSGCKRCDECWANLYLYNAIKMPTKRKHINPKIEAFVTMDINEKIKICTAYSISGDIIEYTKKYNVNKPEVINYVIRWFKDAVVMKGVKDNLLLLKQGVERMNY